MLSVLRGLDKPTGDVIQDLPTLCERTKDETEFGFLFRRLAFGAAIRWIPADISLPAFILEIDLRLIQRHLKQVIAASLRLVFPGGRADAQPVEPQGVAGGDPVG